VGNPLPAIREVLEDDLTPDAIDRAMRSPHEFMRRFAEVSFREGSQSLQQPLPSGVPQLSRVIVLAGQRLRDFDWAEIFLTQVTTALLLGERVSIPYFGNDILGPMPPHPYWVGPFLHFYSTLAPLFDANILETYSPYSREISTFDGWDLDAESARASLEMIRSTGIELPRAFASDSLSSEMQKARKRGDAEMVQVIEAVERAFMHMAVVEALGGGIPWPGMRSTHWVPALIGASLDLYEARPNFEVARAGVLASLTIPNVQELDAQTIVSLRRSGRFSDWHARFSQILDHADQSIQRGATLGQVRTEVESLMAPTAQSLVKEVNESRVLSSYTRGLQSFTLAAVGTLAAGALTGHLGVAESLLASGITGTLTTITGAASKKRDGAPNKDVAQHFQAFMSVWDRPGGEDSLSHRDWLEMDAAWAKNERERNSAWMRRENAEIEAWKRRQQAEPARADEVP
jgi:hypothetical protein